VELAVSAQPLLIDSRWSGQLITTGRSVQSNTPRDGFVQADISTADGIDQIVRAITERLGGIDILIHNVGGSAAHGGGALALTDVDWQHAFRHEPVSVLFDWTAHFFRR